MKKLLVFLLLISQGLVVAQAETEKKTAYQLITVELLKNCEGVDKKIAVAGFSYSDGRDSRDGGVVAERITTELVKTRKNKIIERKEIEKVFAELKFQHSGAIVAESAKEIGKMLGADWVVVGTLAELTDNVLELNARLVGVESGEIISAASVRIEKDWFDQYQRMLAATNKAIEKTPKDAQSFYEQGTIYADLGKYDNAIASFGLAISLDPTNSEAYFDRGNAYYHQGGYDKAIEDYSKTIAIDSRDALAYSNRGVVYGIKGEYGKAIEDYSRAIAIEPKDATPYSNRGEAYRLKGEYDKAIEDSSKAISIDSKHDAAYITRGGAYGTKGKAEKVIEDASRAIEINPTAPAYSLRGLAYCEKKEYDKAIKDSSAAIAIEPNYAEAYYIRGYAYRNKGEIEKAEVADRKYRSLTQK